MGNLGKRIGKLEQEINDKDDLEITVSIGGEGEDLEFERLRERFGFTGNKPKCPVFTTLITTGPDGKERVKFSPPLVEAGG